MILADVFESFRNTTLQKYKLDPAHFRTALIPPRRDLSINIDMSGSVNSSSLTLVFLRHADQLRLGAVMKLAGSSLYFCNVVFLKLSNTSASIITSVFIYRSCNSPKFFNWNFSHNF